MSYFVLSTYRVGEAPTEEQKEQTRFPWEGYFDDAVDIDPGVRPKEGFKTVTADGEVIDGEGPAEASLTGVQVFEAEDIDGAIEIAKSCPILSEDGYVTLHPRVES